MKKAVGHEVKCLSNLIRREMDGGGMPKPATIMQSLFIGYLMRHRDAVCYQRDLEAEFRIRRSTASGILRLMERDGLIRREPVESDARLKRLVLTPKAVESCHCMEQAIEAVEAKTTAGLSDEELETFFALVDKMKKNLEPSGEEHSP